MERTVVFASSISGARLSETLHAPESQLASHAHEGFTFCHVAEGSFLECDGHRTRAWRTGETVLREIGQEHSNRFGAEQARCFNVEVEKGLMERAGSPIQLAPGTTSTMRRLQRELRRPDRSALLLEGYVYQLLGESARVEARRHTAWLSHAERQLRRRFAEPLTIRGLANDIGIHPVTLSRGFREHRGVSVGAFLMRLRLDHAAALLAQTNDPIAQIALACGFSDQSHFTKVFRRSRSTTPRRYRLRFRSRG